MGLDRMEEVSTGGYAKPDPPVPKGKPESAAACKAADDLRDSNEFAKSRDACAEALKSDPDNSDLLWGMPELGIT